MRRIYIIVAIVVFALVGMVGIVVATNQPNPTAQKVERNITSFEKSGGQASKKIDQVSPGSTEDSVRSALGSPDTIQNVGGDTATSYWYYGRVQLIFDNGTLTKVYR